MPGRTYDELESLLEDAVLLRDRDAVAALFEPHGLLVVGDHRARGPRGIARAAPRLWARDPYLADPSSALRVHGLALAVGAESVTVARCGTDGLWRYPFAVVLHGNGPSPSTAGGGGDETTALCGPRRGGRGGA